MKLEKNLSEPRGGVVLRTFFPARKLSVRNSILIVSSQNKIWLNGKFVNYILFIKSTLSCAAKAYNTVSTNRIVLQTRPHIWNSLQSIIIRRTIADWAVSVRNFPFSIFRHALLDSNLTTLGDTYTLRKDRERMPLGSRWCKIRQMIPCLVCSEFILHMYYM